MGRRSYFTQMPLNYVPKVRVKFNCENVHGNNYMVPYRNQQVRISALSTAIEATRKHWMRERSRCVHVSEGDEMPILTFETRLRFCFLQSHSSRREREFFHLISGFETRSRVLFASSRPREKIENFCHLISKFETRSRIFNENFYLSCDIWNCILLYSTNTYFWIRKSPKHVFHHIYTKQISAPPPPAFPLGSFSKTRLFDSTKSYSGLRTIQLQYILVNFHFCPTCLKTSW